MPSNLLKRLKVSLWGGLFFCLTSIAAEWRDPQWLRLLHYNESLTGNHLSETDGMAFFLHPRGKISPSKELKTFIKKLSETTTDPNDHVYCRFPARWRWYKARHPEAIDPKIECPKLNAFRKRLDAHSVAMVFSSYYLNNPSSSFGHTFLRFGRSPESVLSGSTPTELLDTGINYGAVTGDAGPLIYTVGGLAGWFPGTFNAIPYYYKVREYNDYETRDLWSYQLNVTKPELDFMVDHIWELGHTHFDYYFLTENCSYHMLTILEAAKPEINLLKHLPYLYTIPSDTLKALEKEGLVGKVSFRPAPSTLFDHLIKQTSPGERKIVSELFQHPDLKVDLPDERKALVYDAAISLVDFKLAKEIIKEEEGAQKLKRPLLLARSKIPQRSEEPDFTYKLSSAPHYGHGSKRLMIGSVNENDKWGTDLNWRFAFHDLLDNEVAYPHRSRLEVGHIGIRTFGSKVQVRDVSFVDIMNLGKLDTFNQSASWKIRLGHWQTRLDKRDYSTQGFKGGYGYSYHWEKVTPYLLAHVESSYVSEAFRKMKLAYGADAGLLFDFNEAWKMNSVLEWRAYPWTESRVINEFRYANEAFGSGLYFNDYLENGDREFGLRLYWYL